MKVLEKEVVHLSGRYLVTDPCYLYSNDDIILWHEFCDLLFQNEERVCGVIKTKELTEEEQSKLSVEERLRYLATNPGSETLDETKISRRSVITLFDINGKEVPVMSTAYGDGMYPVFNPSTGALAGSFGVDAGLFCFFPVHDVNESLYNDLGPILDLNGVLTCKEGDAYLDGILTVRTSD